MSDKCAAPKEWSNDTAQYIAAMAEYYGDGLPSLIPA